MEEFEEEELIDIDSIEDEQTLIDLLDEAEDFDERKRIRDRLRKVQFELKSQRAEKMRKLEEERENAVKRRLQEADEKKSRTLAMYDQMAKSAPAGGKKVMDINIYRSNEASEVNHENATMNAYSPSQRKDTVEDAIRQRLQESENRKKRILAAFDHAAKSAPAGATKIVNFDAFRSADVKNFTPTKPKESSCTFGMSGGIPKVVKSNQSKQFDQANLDAHSEDNLDPMERAIRARQREAEERKRRTLAAYDIIARSGEAGPKVVVLEEFRDLKVSDDVSSGPKCNPTASFRAGVLQTAGSKN